MNIRLHHESTEEVFVGLGSIYFEEGEPEADITICNGFFHFLPRNDGSCQTEKCTCRDREMEVRNYDEQKYHRRKHEFAMSEFMRELDEERAQSQLSAPAEAMTDDASKIEKPNTLATVAQKIRDCIEQQRRTRHE